MKIHKQGYHSIAFIVVIGLILSSIGIFTKGTSTLFSIILIAISISLILLVTLFFRYEIRDIPDEYLNSKDNCVLVPTDGKVAAIEKVHEKMYFDSEKIKISIYMDLFNIHVNWIPITGTVSWKRHFYGKNYPAFNPKSSLLNERCYTVIKFDNSKNTDINNKETIIYDNENVNIYNNLILNNTLNSDSDINLSYTISSPNSDEKLIENEVMVVQIAGLIARRIVNFKKTGDKLIQGKELGIIKFGSRVDVYLPLNAQVKVSVGQKVKAIETLLATIPNY